MVQETWLVVFAYVLQFTYLEILQCYVSLLYLKSPKPKVFILETGKKHDGFVTSTEAMLYQHLCKNFRTDAAKKKKKRNYVFGSSLVLRSFLYCVNCTVCLWNGVGL